MRRTIFAAAALALCSFAHVARASALDALSFVSPEAPAALVAPSIDLLDRQASQLTGALELTTMSSVKGALRVIGLGDAIDTSAPLAVILAPPRDAEPGAWPEMVFVVRSTPGEALMGTLRAERVEGRDWIMRYMDQSFFARALGDDWFAIAEQREALDQWVAPNSRAFWNEELASPGRALAESAGLCVIARLDRVMPVLEALPTEMLGGPIMTTPLARLFTRIDGEEDAGAIIDAMPTGVRARFDDLRSACRSVTIGLTPSVFGLRADASVRFEPDHPLARAASAPFTSDSDISALPAGGWYAAMGAQPSHPAIAWLFDVPAPIAGETDSAWRNAARTFATGDAGAMLFTPPAGFVTQKGMMPGMLATWRASDPQRGIDAFAKLLADAERTSIGARTLERGEVPPVAATLFNDALTIAGQALDAWAVSVESIPVELSPLLGTNTSHSGFAWTDASRGYISATQNRDATARLLAQTSKNFGGTTLDTNRVIRQLQRMLPSNPAMQGYVDLRPLPRMLGPLMLAIAPGLQIPNDLPPIGAALAFEDGCAHAGTFVSVQHIQTMVAWQAALDGAMAGGQSP